MGGCQCCVDDEKFGLGAACRRRQNLLLFAGIGGSAVRTKIVWGSDGLVASGRGEIDGNLCLEIDYWIIGFWGLFVFR